MPAGATPSGEEIRAALSQFAARWRDYAGSERGEAQSFLNELIACYGSDRRDLGAVFEDSHAAVGIMDMHLPGVVIVEMKAPAEAHRLAEHRRQALNYWRTSSDARTSRAAPPYVVLCAFRQFEVWEPGRFPDGPRAQFTLDELPDSYETLLFFAGTSDVPLFGAGQRRLTEDAARVVGDLYQTLVARRAAAPETLRAFVMQLVWCFFAEDLGMLEHKPVERIIGDLIVHPERSSYTELGTLFDVLNDPDDYGRQGVLSGTRYVNGELFARPAKVHLLPAELESLRRAVEFDWRLIDPTIFGSLMEACLGHERRWELGAHYTHEADIMKIVRPTIVAPWRERIEATSTPAQARALLDELCGFRVLDPACGCGNFLYLAYRELRSLEHDLKARIITLAGQTGLPAPAGPLPFVPLGNMYGIDIEEFSVLIARVTLWMGHRQMVDQFGPSEPVLPLVDLSGIRVGDALRVPWPEIDVIIGNPPFNGSQHLRRALGDMYVEWLKRTFQVGIKDYCVYWFRRAHDHLKPGQRAGLVGTNSISQNRARSASLQYLVDNGGIITDAVSTQKWPGEAKVHVSLVNWIKQPDVAPSDFTLDGESVTGITAELRTPERSTGDVASLAANKDHCFQGPIPVGDGFIIGADEATDLLGQIGVMYADVVRPYLTAADITEHPLQQPSRWIIDFAQRTLEVAMRYPLALDIVRDRVRPMRSQVNRKGHREKWWLFGEPRVGMRKALAGRPRFIAVAAHAKRVLFTWCTPRTLASNATMVFAFDDNYSMGVLASFAHGAWARSRSSTLENRLRYTPSSVFETFPWPYPVTDQQRERVAAASREVIARRQSICAAENFGLTRLYNLVDDGAYTDVRDAHRELDEAVAAAYGWPRSTARDPDEIVRRLLVLNRDITAGRRPYDPFGGAPASTPALDLH